MINNKFARLWSAYTISVIGDWAYRIAIPLVVYDITQSVFLMSAAYAATFAPFIIIMPFGGVIADIIDRKILLWATDIASGAVAFAICFYLAAGFANIYILLLAFAMLGALASISHPAFQGFIPGIVDRSKLAKANSMITTSDSILNLVAPAISGILIAAIGAYNVLWINAASFFLSAFLILTIKSNKKTAVKKLDLSITRITHDLMEGFEIAMTFPLIKWGTFLFILVNFSSHIILGNIIYYLTKNLGLDASQAGIVLGLSASGAIMGAVIAPYFIKRFHSGRFMLTSVALSAIGTAMLLLSSEWGIYSVIVGRAITNASEAMIVVTMFTERQRLIPDQFLSRTVAITRTISYIPVPIAAMAGGYLLSMFGGDMTGLIVISTAVLVLCVFIGLFTPFVSRQIFTVE